MSGFTSLEYMLLMDCGAAQPVEGDELNKMKIVKKNIPPAALPVITARYNAQQRSEVPVMPQRRNVGAVAVRPPVSNFEGMFRLARPLAFKKKLALSDLEELLLTEMKALRPVTPEDTEAIRQQAISSEHADALAAEYRLTLDLGALGNMACKLLDVDDSLFDALQAADNAAGGAAGGAGAAAGGS
jgi:hypothetical protein